ncbi:MAG: PfkB family carbohydrate kinase [Minisyncoccia bacterium]
MKSFKNKRIAVIGDIMLDRFLEGDVTRKSPEANAPVILWQGERNVLGGAANVAANIKSMGGIPEIYSVTGNDSTARTIRKLLRAAKIVHRLIIDKGRTTTLKTRIFASGKYLLRLDQEKKDSIPEMIANKLLKDISRKFRAFDAVVFSDYDKGVLTHRMTKNLISLSKKYHIPIIADVKPKNASKFFGVTIVKPNANEAAKISGVTDLPRAARKISDKLSANVVITNGAKGMLICERGRDKILFIKGHKVKVKDIVGAGDVVSAVLSLSLATKETLYDAALLANKAAALSVEKHGTTTVSINDIIKH